MARQQCIGRRDLSLRQLQDVSEAAIEEDVPSATSNGGATLSLCIVRVTKCIILTPLILHVMLLNCIAGKSSATEAAEEGAGSGQNCSPGLRPARRARESGRPRRPWPSQDHGVSEDGPPVGVGEAVVRRKTCRPRLAVSCPTSSPGPLDAPRLGPQLQTCRRFPAGCCRSPLRTRVPCGS